MKLSLNTDTSGLLIDIKEKTGQGINQILCEAIRKYHQEQVSSNQKVQYDEGG